MQDNRTYSAPFLVQMTSGDFFEHCDVYPHGSIHEVRTCENGKVWNTKRLFHSINSEFKFVVLDAKPETKQCPRCNNEYPENWVFITDRDTKETTCVRCYERVSYVDQENYRNALRAEIKMEFGIK